MKTLTGSKTKLGFALVVVLVGLVAGRAGTLAEDPEAKAVRETVLRGEQVRQRLDVVPAGDLGGKLGSDTKNARLADAREKMASAFSPALVSKEIDLLAGSMDKSGDFDPLGPAGPFPIVVQDGGASAIDYPSVVVRGSTANVTADLKAWVTMAQVREGKAYPAHATNVIIVKDVLSTQADGRWLIVSRSMTYPPGQGP